MRAQGSHPFYLLSYTETAPTGTNDETLLFGGGETAGEGAEGATRKHQGACEETGRRSNQEQLGLERRGERVRRGERRRG